MIFDGLKIMLIGMGTVFFFLALLIVSIQQISSLIAPFTHLLADNKSGQSKKTVKKTIQGKQSQLLAVISAAVYHYKRNRGEL